MAAGFWVDNAACLNFSTLQLMSLAQSTFFPHESAHIHNFPLVLQSLRNAFIIFLLVQVITFNNNISDLTDVERSPTTFMYTVDTLKHSFLQ